MLIVHCPSCLRTLRLPDTVLGQRARCPLCQKVVSIERDTIQVEEGVQAEEPRPVVRASEGDARRPRRIVQEPDEDAPPRSSGGLPILLALLAVGAVVLCGGVVGLLGLGWFTTRTVVVIPPPAGPNPPGPGMGPGKAGAGVRVLNTPEKSFLVQRMDVAALRPERGVISIRERARGGSRAEVISIDLIDGAKKPSFEPRADLVSREPDNVLELRLRAVAPNSDRVLLSWNAGGSERFSVVDLDGKVVRQDWTLGRKPLPEDRSGRQTPRSMFFLVRNRVADRLLVGYPDSGVTVFAIDTGEAKSLVPPRAEVRADLAAPSVFAVSSSGSTLFSWRGGGNFALNDIGSGRERRQLALPLGKDEQVHLLLDASFGPDNDQVAVLAVLNKDGNLVPIVATWDATDGKFLTRVQLPDFDLNVRRDDRVGWWGKGHILIGNSRQTPAYLVDFAASKLIARVNLAGGAQLAHGHDGSGSLWMFVNDPVDVVSPPKLLRVDFPAAAVQRCTEPASVLTIGIDGVSGP